MGCFWTEFFIGNVGFQPVWVSFTPIFIIIIIIINYFYNAHNTLQGMSLCAVRKKRLGGGTVQVHDIIEIIQIGRFLKQT